LSSVLLLCASPLYDSKMLFKISVIWRLRCMAVGYSDSIFLGLESIWFSLDLDVARNLNI
jgi:hypothetical protein